MAQQDTILVAKWVRTRGFFNIQLGNRDHFGYIKNKPYIHLNNNDPNDPTFDILWSDIKIANSLGIKIILMVGGAGGAYTSLFSNYNILTNGT